MIIDQDMSVLVLVDVQREYTTPGRPFFLNGIEPSLQNCRRLLAYWRHMSWPVAHVRHLQKGRHVFAPGSEYSDFVDGFHPKVSEMLFTKEALSCFSARGFEELLESSAAAPVYLAGYNSAMCCLATLVDAHNRGYRLRYVADASMARTRDGDPVAAHEVLTSALSAFADVVATDSVLERRELAA